MTTTNKRAAARPKPAAVFSKEKILTFPRYAPRRDLLSALLAEGENYTLEQVNGLLQNFMKGKVN